MNTNPKAKRILIYGDSIPWGIVIGSRPFERHSPEVRWPGKLQQLLGDGYEIIEENLVGRTLGTDDARPGFEGRNGLTSLATILDSQDPLDIIIVSLGLNEAKGMFDATVEQVGEKMGLLLQTIIERKPNFREVNTRIILLLPYATDESKAKKYWGDIWDGSCEKSKALGTEFIKVAQDLGVEILDVRGKVVPGSDGVHLDEDGHMLMAETVRKAL
jgi:lysophospholipase L1-like esterase